MQSFIEILNQWGGGFVHAACSMFWQSSLLILLLLGLDYASERRLRASVRHALWLVVLVKLCLPPTFALPTSPVWWLPKSPTPVTQVAENNYSVTYDQSPPPAMPLAGLRASLPSRPTITVAAGLLVLSGGVSIGLLGWMLVRWGQIRRRVGEAAISPRLARLARESQLLAGLEGSVAVRLAASGMSPAVCGLFRPVILLPQTLAEHFSDEQLRAVLVHEMIHLRRRDVWVNFAQGLLQMIYWWHPLVWVANSRLRSVREEAVDDAVMLALGEEAEDYAPTLLEVAKLAWLRPRVSLGLLGILESRRALGRRIERLLEAGTPRQAGLTLASLLGILAFTAVAVPMGDSPAPPDDPLNAPDPILKLTVNPEVFIRNIRAEASLTEYAATDAYTNILLGILHREGVDFGRPGSFHFDPSTGDITTQSIPDSLEIFRRVIEQLNRPDGNCALPLNLAGFHRRSVLIDGQIFAMSATDFQALTNQFIFQSATSGVENTLTGAIAAEQFDAFKQRLRALGLTPFQRPRIQTAHGTTAQFFVGSSVEGVNINGVEFDCRPTVGDGHIGLAFRGEIKGDLAADGKTLTGAVVHKIGGNVLTDNRGGILICASNPGGPTDKYYVLVLGVQLVTNQASQKAHAQATAVVVNHEGVAYVRAAGNGQSGESANPEPVEPLPQIHIKARFLEVPNSVPFSAATYANTNVNLAGVAGILSSKNTQTILRALEKNPDVKTLAEPEVTTTSGRQTQMRATSTISVVTGATNQIGTNGSNAISFNTAKIETGPILDATARVMPDGATIELSATASITDFLGYDMPPPHAVGEAIPRTGEHLPIVLPCFSIREGSATVKIWDDQTVLVGKLANHFFEGGHEVATEPARFHNPRSQSHVVGPETNDIVTAKPHVGPPDYEHKDVLVFIIVTLVDAAGNRIHSNGTPPFGGDSVPPQGPTDEIKR